jgi:hypothetical protein
MGVVGKAVLIVLIVPFATGLYVLGNKPAFGNDVLVAYDSNGVLAAAGVLAGAPDVLAIAGLAVLMVFVGPYLRRSRYRL